MTPQEIKDKAYRCDYPYGHGNHVKDAAEYGYLQGANDVLKSMYSEEDMLNLAGAVVSICGIVPSDRIVAEIKQWVEEYKKQKHGKQDTGTGSRYQK